MIKQRRKESLISQIQIKMARTQVDPETLGEFLQQLSLDELEGLAESSKRAVEEELEEERLRRWLSKVGEARASYNVYERL